MAGALVLSVGPAVAVAKPGCGSTTTVPGSSEIDQYAQSIPGACGNQENGSQSGGGGSSGGDGGGGGSEGSGPSAGSSISPSTSERLRDLGAAGTATETLAEQNAPRIKADGKGSDGGGSGGGQSQPGAVVGAALGSGDGGMGIVLPLILLAVAVGGGLYVARRRAGQAG